jgi:hypothetical protein
VLDHLIAQVKAFDRGIVRAKIFARKSAAKP